MTSCIFSLLVLRGVNFQHFYLPITKNCKELEKISKLILYSACCCLNLKRQICNNGNKTLQITKSIQKTGSRLVDWIEVVANTKKQSTKCHRRIPQIYNRIMRNILISFYSFLFSISICRCRTVKNSIQSSSFQSPWSQIRGIYRLVDL